jgi:hypothetical protein
MPPSPENASDAFLEEMGFDPVRFRYLFGYPKHWRQLYNAYSRSFMGDDDFPMDSDPTADFLYMGFTKKYAEDVVKLHNWPDGEYAWMYGHQCPWDWADNYIGVIIAHIESLP